MRSPRTVSPFQTPVRCGFTLIEMLVAVAILAMLLVLLLSAMSHTTRIWRQATNTIDAYQSAREAFNLVKRKLGEANLNTYWAYEMKRVGAVDVPTGYRRESDLHFLCGPQVPGAGISHAVFFQTPDGFTRQETAYGAMDDLLNDCGFFLSFGTDAAWRPGPAAGLPPRSRYRVIQWLPPAEASGPFSRTQTWLPPASSALVDPQQSVPIGDNIVALVFFPKRSPQDESVHGPLPGGFSYDSRSGTLSTPQPITANQLPSLVEIIMVAIDEHSALRLADQYGAAEPTTVADALVGRLQDPSVLEKDLKDITDDLSTSGIASRIFRATVPLPASKWSESP